MCKKVDSKQLQVLYKKLDTNVICKKLDTKVMYISYLTQLKLRNTPSVQKRMQLWETCQSNFIVFNQVYSK